MCGLLAADLAKVNDQDGDGATSPVAGGRSGTVPRRERWPAATAGHDPATGVGY